MEHKHAHFQGKKALQHVIDARLKGALASEELHGVEIAGHYSATADAAKETAFLFLVLWALFKEIAFPFAEIQVLSVVFLCSFAFWKVGRSAILGYHRLERLHRVIEEERFEIEHHREQEREELTALYKAKGFSGKLLEEVLDVLMADDNRLLQVMLEEELGLNLGTFEHPLKQALGAFVGVFGAAIMMSFGLFVWPEAGVIVAAGLVIALSAAMTAQLQKNQILPPIFWNLGVAFCGASIAYFLAQIFL